RPRSLSEFCAPSSTASHPSSSLNLTLTRNLNPHRNLLPHTPRLVIAPSPARNRHQPDIPPALGKHLAEQHSEFQTPPWPRGRDRLFARTTHHHHHKRPRFRPWTSLALHRLKFSGRQIERMRCLVQTHGARATRRLHGLHHFK